METRREAGTEAQVGCFGDYYTRTLNALSCIRSVEADK